MQFERQIDRRLVERQNRKLLRDLAERVKELTALHAATRILQGEWKETSAVLAQLVGIVPSAMQYPEATVARIRLGENEAATPNFATASSLLRAEFTTADGQPGSIEIGFTEGYPSEAEGPFLTEERDLIDTLSDMLRTAYDRRHAEMALSESEERFRQLTENIHEVFWMGTPAVDEILYASPAYESVWGRTRESLYSDHQTFIDSIHPEDRQRVVDFLAEVPQQGFQLEYRILRPDGQVRWIWDRGFPIEDESGRVYRLAGLAEDITERKMAEQTLRSTEQHFRALIEKSSDAISLCGPDGTIMYASPSTPQVLGFTPDELVGLNVFDVVHPDDRAMLARHMSELVGCPGISIRMESRVRHKDGSWRWLEGTQRNLLEEPSVGAIVYNYRDISGRKQAEEQFRGTTEELRALSENILSAREQEGARIAREIHDELGSALTSLKWDLEGIDKAISTSSDQSQLLPVRKRIEEMTKLMDTTINVVRRIASELRPSVLDDLGLGEALEWQAQQFQERTGLICHCDGALHDLNLSEEQATAVFRIFQEALTNILRHAQATHVRFVMQEDEDEFRLTITDNGRGITNEEKSGQRSIGLLGMRERAYLIGGTVDISGSKGKGTVVTVRVRSSGSRPPRDGVLISRIDSVHSDLS
ncbi:MAG: PAS domain S-box protein [Pyrinomonadaceae bacterium]|nr:PAS domain S-box protein [Pyrinomonadaceae bacterium]